VTPARRPVHDGHAYEAGFEPADGSDLVLAAFACPGCLFGARALALVDARERPVAELACPACARLWQVELTLAQVLALLLAPPSALEVRRGPQAEWLLRLATITPEDIGC
jgi:hypothetical protein